MRKTLSSYSEFSNNPILKPPFIVIELTKRRSKFETIIDILNEIKRGTTRPSRIMFATNISFKPFKKILKTLTDKKLIYIRGEGKRSRITLTEKGENILVYGNKTIELIM